MKVTAIESDLYDFKIEKHISKSRLNLAAEVDITGKTPFEYFVRLDNVWAFGKY